MKILIIFETGEGQTRKIAEFAAGQIRSAGHQVQLFNAQEKMKPLSFDGIDKVMLAAPVHERRHPKAFELLVATSLPDLNDRPTLLFSVSLKAAFPEGLEEAQDYLTEMKMRTGLEPDREVLVAGAVRTDSYGYYESQIVKNIALEGQNVELVDGVREFTDWDKLGNEISVFLQAD